MTKKTAIITGITGQDGAYLAQLLLEKGYRVIGTYRRTSSVNFWRIEELGISEHPTLQLVEYDLTDLGVEHLACSRSASPTRSTTSPRRASSACRFEQPVTTAQITGLGALHLLEAIRLVNPQDPLLPGVARPRCSARCRPFRRRRTRPSIRAAPTAWPSCTRTG